MENEIQPLGPQNEPSLDATNQQGLLPNGEIDHEGAMAKADLFKLGQYSYKLFKKLEDDTQLESWVQAKITKAADYITSVYHYMEFEMKFSEYGKKLDDSDVLSESQKAVMKNKLMEAKSKIRDLKIAEAKKSKSKDAPVINNFVAKNAQTSGAGVHQSEKDKSKFPRKAKHKNKDMQLDEISRETLKPYIKAASQDLVDKSIKYDRTESGKKKTDLGRKISNRTSGIASATDRLEEASKDKNKKFAALAPPKDKITYADKIAGATKSKKVNEDFKDDEHRELFKKYKAADKHLQDVQNKKVSEKERIDAIEARSAAHRAYSFYKPKKLDEAKPSAGLSVKKKSATVKAKAKDGKDNGRKAAAMWKNIKESVELNESLFSDSSPEEIAKTNSTMAELIAFRSQYQGTQWSKQIEDRIKQLTIEINNDHIPQGPDGKPMKALPPEEWAKRNPHGIQESTEMAFGEGVYEKDEQLDELNFKKWLPTKDEDPKRRHTKDNFSSLHSEHGPISAKIDELKNQIDELDEQNTAAADIKIAELSKQIVKLEKRKQNAGEKAAKAKYEDLNESADLERMKEFLTRLNG